MSTRSIRIKAILSMGILVGFGAVSTLAAWTGTATATSNISSATVALGVGATAGAANATTYQMPITGNNLYPGTSSASTVVVKNTGTISAPYTVQGKITESGASTLGAGLNISVKIGATVSGSGSNVTCSGGTTIVSKSAGAQFNGSSTPRSLDSGASELLCIQYSLPTTAANSLQGATTSIGLTFTSTVGS
ncbi:hypothetical protein ACT3UD_14375 [Glutamicibacter sp. 287]|uniref:hypothetical protein n=1 Tax=unclassified Glutamicibacter TaxID=2627139 RepID=UPI0040342B65